MFFFVTQDMKEMQMPYDYENLETIILEEQKPTLLKMIIKYDPRVTEQKKSLENKYKCISVSTSERTDLLDSLKCYWQINHALAAGLLGTLPIEW